MTSKRRKKKSPTVTVEKDYLKDSLKEQIKEAEKNYETARKVLFLAQEEYEEKVQTLQSLKKKLKLVEKGELIYLVSPKYSGPQPKSGKFFSTQRIPGWTTLTVAKPRDKIAETLTDMEICGYVSEDEYFKDLRFVSLCIEADDELDFFEILRDDDDIIRNLLEVHMSSRVLY